MDVEQLKLVLGTLHDAGTGALIFGLCYLAKDVVLALVICGALGLVVMRIARGITEASYKYTKVRDEDISSERSEQAVLERIAYLSGVSRPIWLTDRRKVDEWLSKAEAAIKATGER